VSRRVTERVAADIRQATLSHDELTFEIAVHIEPLTALYDELRHLVPPCGRYA